jgi:hypothetical protein
MRSHVGVVIESKLREGLRCRLTILGKHLNSRLKIAILRVIDVIVQFKSILKIR